MNGSSFFEREYGRPLTEEVFDRARGEIHLALENLYEAETIWELFRQGQRHCPQRAVTFKQAEQSVRVVPDLITFRSQRAPVVLDWKVNAYPMRDYWLQLVTGAMGVTRCKPHRDWPIGSTKYNAHEVELLEVQLLTGDVRSHTATEEDVHEAEDFIAMSAADMELACGGEEVGDLHAEEFPVALDPGTCQTCPFKKICWSGQP